MNSTLRFLHIIGLCLFLGSLPSHIILGMVVPGGDIPDQGVMFAHIMIKVITATTTVPGLLLLGVTGVLRWRKARGRTGARWFSIHITFGTVALLNGLIILTPAVLTLADQSAGLIDGTVPVEMWYSTKNVLDIAGTLNLLLGVLAVALVCFRPSLGQGTAQRDQ